MMRLWHVYQAWAKCSQKWLLYSVGAEGCWIGRESGLWWRWSHVQMDTLDFQRVREQSCDLFLYNHRWQSKDLGLNSDPVRELMASAESLSSPILWDNLVWRDCHGTAKRLWKGVKDGGLGEKEKDDKRGSQVGGTIRRMGLLKWFQTPCAEIVILATSC